MGSVLIRVFRLRRRVSAKIIVLCFRGTRLLTGVRVT